MSDETLAAARQLVTKTKLQDILADQAHVTVLKSDSTVDQALKVLASHRILSAPVVQPGPEGSADEIVCFVDLRDVLSSFLASLDMDKLNAGKMLQKMRILETQGQRFATKTIKELPYAGGDGCFLFGQQARHASLREVIYDGFLFPRETKAAFGGTRTRRVVHRLALFDSTGHITNIISQSDIVRYLHKRKEQLGDELLLETVDALGMGASPVISVTPETAAIDAMALMNEKEISALAVVDKNGRLIGNFSITELRTIMSEHFGSLALPVGEFLALEHGTEYEGYAIQGDVDQEEIQASAGGQFAQARRTSGSRHPSPPPARSLARRSTSFGSHGQSVGHEVGQSLICCVEGTPLTVALDLLVSNRLHRLYVIDSDQRPLRVISLTDVLRLVTQQH